MEIRTPQYRIRVIPPCPHCGAPRPWRDGRYRGRQRRRCRACRFAWVERPWYEARHRQQEAYRIVGSKFVVTRRADAALRRQAETQRVLGEFARSVQAELMRTLNEFFRSVQAVTAPLYRNFQAVLQAVCPRCRAIETVRDGYIRGRPRRRCRACGCRYVAEARWRRVRPPLEP